MLASAIEYGLDGLRKVKLSNLLYAIIRYVCHIRPHKVNCFRSKCPLKTDQVMMLFV